MQALRNQVSENLFSFIEELKSYVSLPSVSAQNRAIPETVRHVAQMIKGAGGTVHVLDDLGGNPVIYGFFPAGEKGNRDKTLLYYNHYDVQPPEPYDEWESDPFEPAIRDGKLYARGVSDNKGDLVARLSAIKVLQELDGGLPCNVKFMIEGEEEIGSPNLAPYLTNYKELFRADACIWEFGHKDEKERVSMVAGVKGMAYLQFTCVGADVDMHSSVGAYVDNAAWRLVQALASMRSVDHKILVEGFYDGILPPTEAEMRAVKSLPFDQESVKSLYGLKRPLITEDKGQDPRAAMVFEPTMTICGIESGYYGKGSKTVLPKRTQAKIDCRLVPNQDPEHILHCVRTHLEKHGFMDVRVEMINGQRAYRSNYADPFVSLVVKTAQEAYGSEVVLAPNAAGTGPMYEFGHQLQLPVVSTGVGWVNSRAHAPNESIRLYDFEQGIVYMAFLLEEFGKMA
ncbi:M20/M25/M40 family metallo-hydrolase [Fodinisporobacter ferrooxydans]|uniref:M20/M25/M40 family metallo-hydrolase n=1 Tax=Fodinisporobacter ferrooxydans TaxID=2901836 RepID=A0ABY4CQI1_9BACL|nr:M20/M25/M40 family metallo-hydrolase [Alicyclobacillaceae bacterium MYW30-H2]